MQTLNIIKIGGNIVNNEERLDKFLNNFMQVKHPKILVHGGGRSASDLCERLEIPIKMNEGRRITDAPALDVAVMVYAGLINKNIVAKLQALSCNALGLSGADLNTIPAKKRSDGNIDYGFVGDVNSEDINTYFIRRLLDEQIVPVFPAVTHDNNGQLLNTNADSIASSLAISLAKKHNVQLVYCFEKIGVLKDVENDDSLIDHLTQDMFADLKQDGTIHEGMIPKLETAFESLGKNVQSVHIKHAKNLTTQIGTELSL